MELTPDDGHNVRRLLERWKKRPLLLTGWRGAAIGAGKLGGEPELQILMALTARVNKSKKTTDFAVLMEPDAAIAMGEWLLEWGHRAHGGLGVSKDVPPPRQVLIVQGMAISPEALERITRVNETLAQLTMVDVPDVIDSNPSLQELRALGDLALALHSHSQRIKSVTLDALELVAQRIGQVDVGGRQRLSPAVERQRWQPLGLFRGTPAEGRS